MDKKKLSVLGLLFAFVFTVALSFTLATSAEAGPDLCCDVIFNGEIVCKGHVGTKTHLPDFTCHTQYHEGFSGNCEHWCLL